MDTLTMSSTDSLKIFTEPREKRSDLTPPLVLKKTHSVEPFPAPKLTKVNSTTSGKPRCMARISTGLQCNRPKKDEFTEYCTCHLKHRPYGRFDGPLEGKKFLAVPKKRGPPFKNTKEYTLEELDQDLYQETQLIQIDDNCYLIDKLGVLYSNDNKCDVVGRQNGDYIAWFV